MLGTVKWYQATKGYGFITPDDGSKDLFVHHSAVKKAGRELLQEGDRFDFNVVTGPRGGSAVDLKAV